MLLHFGAMEKRRNVTLVIWKFYLLCSFGTLLAFQMIENKARPNRLCLWHARDRYYYTHFTIMMKSFTHIYKKLAHSMQHNITPAKTTNNAMAIASSSWERTLAITTYISTVKAAFLTILLHTHFKRLHKFDIQDGFLLLLIYSLVDCDCAPCLALLCALFECVAWVSFNYKIKYNVARINWLQYKQTVVKILFRRSFIRRYEGSSNASHRSWVTIALGI